MPSPPTSQRKEKTMHRALLLCALVPLCQGAAPKWTDLQANPSYEFARYVRDFEKTYATDAEYALRQGVFERNLAAILKHNGEEHSWKMGVNEFSDWEPKEVLQKRTGHSGQRAQHVVGTHVVPTNVSIPVAVDWRAIPNIVNPVKNQGACGSCWAFSTAAAVESAVAIHTGFLFSLSEQQLVSCAPNPLQCGGTGGCAGSTQPVGFNYTIGTGLSNETHYPYTHKTGTCDKTKILPVAGITGHVEIANNDADALLHAVATVGPIAISVAAADWHAYETGVYSGSCGYEVDHAVVLVGYAADYWIVRNSWGATWGESGYIRIARHTTEPCGMDNKPQDGVACKGQDDPIKYCGQCAILSASSYPTGAFQIPLSQ